jgi:regulatory protein
MDSQQSSRKGRVLDEAALWEYALKALAARAQSVAGLREKLRRRAARAADADAVLSRLKRYGLLNDQRFAESYATARVENQGFGKARVLRDLRQRRVASKVAQQVTEAVFQGRDEVQLIEDFLKRKYRKVALAAHLAEPKNLAGAYRKLRYAGFSSGNSIRVLRRYSEMADQLEDLKEEP